MVHALLAHFKGNPRAAEDCGLLVWLQEQGFNNVVMNKTACKQWRLSTKQDVIITSLTLYLISESCIKRQVNRVAHNLKKASRFYTGIVCYDYIQICIENLISFSLSKKEETSLVVLDI